jgi:hypothetical protein
MREEKLLADRGETSGFTTVQRPGGFVNAPRIGVEGIAGESKRPRARSAAEMAKLADAALAFKGVRFPQTPE